MLQDIPFNVIVDVINPRIVEEGGKMMSDFGAFVLGVIIGIVMLIWKKVVR